MKYGIALVFMAGYFLSNGYPWIDKWGRVNLFTAGFFLATGLAIIINEAVK